MITFGRILGLLAFAAQSARADIDIVPRLPELVERSGTFDIDTAKKTNRYQ
jgi:hypothetical protein